MEVNILKEKLKNLLNDEIDVHTLLDISVGSVINNFIFGFRYEKVLNFLISSKTIYRKKKLNIIINLKKLSTIKQFYLAQ